MTRVLSDLDKDIEAKLMQSADGAVVVRESCRITFWNSAATKITGYSSMEALGRACCDLFADQDDDGVAGCGPLCTATLDGGPVRTFDIRTRTKMGRALWLNLTALAGQVPERGALIVHLFRDVTASRDLLASVRQSLDLAGEERPACPRPLTHRELEVLRLTARGANTAAIAARLHVSRATVRNHVQHILGKLEVHSRLQAVAHAARQGLL
jgi:PAS domain S-box-containing protein